MIYPEKGKEPECFITFVENALEKLAKEEYASFLSLFDSSRITTEDELILALKYLDETCPIAKIDNPALKLNHQRINLIAFRDGDGYQMDYDLTTDGEPNDLTLQIEFLKTENGYIVSLDDLHTL